MCQLAPAKYEDALPPKDDRPVACGANPPQRSCAAYWSDVVVEIAEPFRVDGQPASLAEHGKAEDTPPLREVGAERIRRGHGLTCGNRLDRATRGCIPSAHDMVTRTEVLAERNVPPYGQRSIGDATREHDGHERLR